jgi:hypothetical protein
MRFQYTPVPNLPGIMMPRLSLTLHHMGQSVKVVGLLDTGAAVNVIPYSVGLALGAVWEEQTTPIPLVGSLGRKAAHALVALATHPELTTDDGVNLIFAWSQDDEAPIIFGQTNFFLEFDVCFYLSQGFFEVERKAGD